MRVKLYGIAAPKNKQDFGAVARKFLRGLADKQSVEVNAFYTGQDGIDAVIVMRCSDKKILNAEIVGAGLAWVDDSLCSVPECDDWSDLQTQAKSAACGLWANANAVAPWYWMPPKKDPAVAENLATQNDLKEEY